MERQPRIISYREDPTPIGRESNGQEITRAKMTQLFEFIPEEQVGFTACRSVANFEVRPQEVFNIINFIGNPDALNQFRIWCTGKGYKLREEQEMDEFQRYERAKDLLTQEDDLIEKLSPYVTQLQMARIVGIRRYRDADEQTKQTLISGTYRLVGEYLGPRRFYKREAEGPKLLPLPELPEELFEDGLVLDILTQAERDAVLEIYNQDVDKCFAYLNHLKTEVQNPVQLQFVENLERHFRNIEEDEVPVVFRRIIAGAQKDIPEDERTASFPFPSRHQKEYAYRFTHKTSGIGMTDLLIGDTKTQKTKGAIYAMEKAGAKNIL